MDGVLVGPARVSSKRPPLVAYLLIVILVPTLSGCARFGGTSLHDWCQNGYKVGPNYCKPSAPVAREWIHVTSENGTVMPDESYIAEKLTLPTMTTKSVDNRYWWSVFNDPKLNLLILDAYEQNLPLRVAGLRVLEARSSAAIAAGNLLPQQQLGVGSFRRSQRSRDFGPSSNSNVWATGFSLAWELDVWGRFRRAIEAADANVEASVEDYDDILLTLVGDVALAYVEIRTLQERLDIAGSNVDRQQKSLKRTRAQVEADREDFAISAKEVEAAIAQQESNVLQTKSRIPALQLSLRQAQNRLCILLGISPRDLAGRLETGNIPNPHVEVHVGLPADLLRRRPDVRNAERDVAVQSARVGIAVSDLYPSFRLNGSLDWSARDFSDVFRADNLGGVINPNFRWNLLNYGRLANNIQLEKTRLERAAVTYENVVLNAQLEAENAMAGFIRSTEQISLLKAAKESSNTAANAVTKQAGALDAAELGDLSKIIGSLRLNNSNLEFNTNVTVLRNENDLALAKQARAASLINLYRALGGGWQLRLNPNAAMAASEMVESNVIYMDAKATVREAQEINIVAEPEELPPVPEDAK